MILTVRRWLSSERVTLDTPFISDTIPLAEGVLGTVEAMLKDVGDKVDEDEVVSVVERIRSRLTYGHRGRA